MNLPCFIALEAASAEEESFPVNLAWSLPDGSIKQALILPEDIWLEDDWVLAGSRDLDLTLEAYSATEVVRELLFDQEDDVYYVAAVHPQEAWLLKLFNAAGQEVSFELIEASSLEPCLDDWAQAYADNLQLLGLNPEVAEEQVAALLATYAQAQVGFS